MTSHISKAIVAIIALGLCGCSWADLMNQREQSTVAMPTGPGGEAWRDSGAGPRNDVHRASEEKLGSLVYLAAERLANTSSVPLSRDKPVLISTVVNVDDFSRSATFGRLVSELVSSRLTQQGYLVRDVTYMRALSVQPDTGELVLSRSARNISANIHAQAVVAGTFAAGGSEIYVNVRLLKADDGAVLSSVDFVIPVDWNTQRLLAGVD